jgi:hypothetical protein
MPHRLSAPTVGRAILGTATVLFFVMALVVRDDPRWYVAAGAAGIFWTLWDLVWGHLLAPLGHWIVLAFSGGLGGPPPNVRPTLEDTIRLLESHITANAARRVQLQAAIRLEEIYRTVKNDPGRARDVIRRVRERFPDAWELDRYR